jgi:hypothetical protein
MPGVRCGEANGSAFAGEALFPARIYCRTAGASATGTADDRKTRPQMPMSGRVIPPTKTQVAVRDETLARA